MNKEVAEQTESLTKLFNKANELQNFELWKDEFKEERIDTDIFSDIIEFCREFELYDRFLSKEERDRYIQIQSEFEEFTSKYRIANGRLKNIDKSFSEHIKTITFFSNQLTYVRDYLIEQYLAQENKDRKRLEYEIMLDTEAMDNLKSFIESTFPIFINRRVTEILNYKLF